MGKNKDLCLKCFLSWGSLVTAIFFAVQISAAKEADLLGAWYSSSSIALGKELKGYLAAAEPENIEGNGIGYIAPHAGFRYSGPIAAYTYKSAAKQKPDTVIIVGFSHRKRFDGVAVFTENEYTTPLGTVINDQELAQKLISMNKGLRDYPLAFSDENSIEMQIPFVQTALAGAKVVLLCFGQQNYKASEDLAEALYLALKDRKGYVMIASTDMSHYLPYDAAKTKDADTITAVNLFDPEQFFAMCVENNYDPVCGPGPVSAVMSASKKLGADKVRILSAANSGDTSGKKESVVGYSSAVFYKEGQMKEGTGINDAEKKELLSIARNSIQHYLDTGELLKVETKDEKLKQNMGAFVTLKKKGALRGCIGHMTAEEPLFLTVRDMAFSAAFQDPRFSPLSLKEFKDIDIEISVLTPMVKIDDPYKILLGKHGVVVKKGSRSGVFLPQVATETGWDLEEFMGTLCTQKAGLPANAWNRGGCDIYVFTAIIFGEKGNE
ncbi:MAG: AmmeMemoRadiSam system protein B [Candidatus Omnitrophica bacterium]|nr:AmmeMemoRadiSam system protein B [Candidatus Omnitrophota bacterium]